MTDHLDARPTPEHDLEHFLAGDLPPHRMAQVRSAVARDPLLRERLDRLEQSSREILAAYPPAVMQRLSAGDWSGRPHGRPSGGADGPGSCWPAPRPPPSW